LWTRDWEFKKCQGPRTENGVTNGTKQNQEEGGTSDSRTKNELPAWGGGGSIYDMARCDASGKESQQFRKIRETGKKGKDKKKGVF